MTIDWLISGDVRVNSAERMQSFLQMDELSLKKIMTMQLILSQVMK